MPHNAAPERGSSRLSGFYRRSRQERAQIVAAWAGLTPDEQAALAGGGLSAAQAEHMIENVIGVYALPLGIATNFLINGRDTLIPMVVEEPSIVAGVSFAAKLAREGGGFTTSADEPVMIGQIQVLDVADLDAAAARVLDAQDELLAEADCCDRVLVELGGGARGLEVRPFPDTPAGPMLIVHLLYDVRDAMGANAINTTVERLAPRIEALTGGRVNLRILSNLADRRKARAACSIPARALSTESMAGPDVARAVVEAAVFAAIDPYRAATHNKGVMNGMDAVAIATGNDWRALEAGAHAWAARDGIYRSLTAWTLDEAGDLRGAIETVLGAAMEEGLVLDAAIAGSVAQRQAMWRIREEHAEAQKREGASVKNDVSVPVSSIPELIARGIAAVRRIVPDVRPCPFGHVGDGNIHFNFSRPEGMDDAAFLARWDAIADAVSAEARCLGGSFSAEHGIGRLKAETLAEWRAGPEIDAMRRIKAALDPRGLMNPGKVVLAR